MSTELRMLACTAGLTLVLWLPYILARMMSYGLVPTVTYAADAKSLPGWAERAKRAHYNAVENLAHCVAKKSSEHRNGNDLSCQNQDGPHGRTIPNGIDRRAENPRNDTRNGSRDDYQNEPAE